MSKITRKFRNYKEKDTIRVVGDQGRLFNNCSNLELEKGLKLGVECVLIKGTDSEGDVMLPRGILANDQRYLSTKCIELVQSVEEKTHFTFDVKTTEGWTHKLTEEEYARFKHLPTPCAVIGFKPKNTGSHIEITKDVIRFRFESDLMDPSPCEETYYTVTCYVNDEKIDSKSVTSVTEAGTIAQSYETFIKYYNQN